MASVKIVLKQRARDKEKKLGALYLQIINVRSDKTEISLKIKLNPEHWDANKQRIKARNRESTKLNVYINNERNAYEGLINNKLAKGIPFTVKEIVEERKEKLNPKAKDGSFTVFFRDYIDKNPENLGYNTLESYTTCYNKTAIFSPNLDFQDFNEAWVLQFEKHLKGKGQAINTIADKMKILKKLSNLCLKEGKIKFPPFQNYKIKKEAGKREYLTKEEFKSLSKLKVEQKSHNWVKDTFIFGCLTGLRFSDLCTLTPDNIKEEKDEKGNSIYRLSIRMQKTKDNLSIKIPKMAIAILEQNDFPISNPLLPILRSPVETYIDEPTLKKEISRRNAYFNKVMKMLCAKAKIEKKISMHCARHTFATISLDLDVPIQVVSKMLGHKSLAETMIYAKIMDKQKDAAVDAWDLM